MKWTEVIKIQTADGNNSSLKKQLNELIAEAGHNKEIGEIKLYHNAKVANDLSIHLYWESNKAEAQGSATALFISHLLKEFGLVSHSVWIEDIK